MNHSSRQNRIVKLTAKNVGLFKDLEIEFNPGMNVIIGPNSSGKSTILKTIGMCFSTHFAEYRLAEGAEFSTHIVCNGKQYLVGLSSGSFPESFPYRASQLKSWKPPAAVTQKDIRSITFGHFSNEPNMLFAPLAIGPNRSIKYTAVQGMKRDEPRQAQIQKYRSSLVPNLLGTQLPNVKQWMINRYYQIDKEWAGEFRHNWNAVMSKLHAISPNSVDFSFKEIREDLEPRFSINGEIVYLEELSSGFQSLLSITFGIVDWIEGVNEGSDRRIEVATGTVLIDEIDAHLHPEWQITILNALREFFPKIQFLITTHSPHIIASCAENELLILPTHDGNLKLKPAQSKFSGWDTDKILEDLMRVQILEKSDVSQSYKRAINAIDSVNTSEFNAAMSELATLCHPSDPILQMLPLKFAQAKLKTV